jgi:hypothetical protein
VQGKGREGKGREGRKHYEGMSREAVIMHHWKLVICHL